MPRPAPAKGRRGLCVPPSDPAGRCGETQAFRGRPHAAAAATDDTNTMDGTKDGAMSEQPLNGSRIMLKALVDQGVDVIFGYPGGAVLPLYDEIFQQNAIRHILVRQEGGRCTRPRATPGPRARWGWCW